MKVKPMYWIIIALNIFSCGTAQESPTDQTEIVVKEEPTQVADSDSSFLNIDYLTGKFEPSTQPGFIKIDTQYSDGSEMWMRKDAYEAFLKMYEAAKKDGINLKIISAARNFNRQKQIWEAKWTGARLVEGKDLQKQSEAGKRAYKILEYSSMPGTSRHHWGTDIDLNNLEPSWFKSGEGAKIYAWPKPTLLPTGFCQPYTKRRNQTSRLQRRTLALVLPTRRLN
ncbi:MAG: M15 family metallopeptidase [Saprospiraceae bacterium]